MQWASERGRVLRGVLRRGSKKGLSRRHLEGRNTPFREYDPLRVRPGYEIRNMSGGIKMDTLKGTNDRNSQFFADFRFYWELQYSGGADSPRNRSRKPQNLAENRSKPQFFLRDPFVPFSLSLLVPPYRNMPRGPFKSPAVHKTQVTGPGPLPCVTK